MQKKSINFFQYVKKIMKCEGKIISSNLINQIIVIKTHTNKQKLN